MALKIFALLIGTFLSVVLVHLHFIEGRKSTAASGQWQNNPPIVKITEPKSNSVFPLNSLVRYSISVSDREDGESRFDEIPPIKYFWK